MPYIAEYTRPYDGGYVDLPSEETPEMAEFINKRDDTLLKIEKYLSELDLSGLGGDYALLSEAGYSINVSIDENYILTISLLNKEEMTLSTRTIDLPIESMVVNASYNSGNLILTLQNGQTIEVDISDMVRGLVPTSRKIAGIDLEDDISAGELQEALGILDNATTAGEIKPYLYKKDEESICGVYMGKPLYRNVIWVPSLGNKETIQVPVNINIENVLKLDGYNYFTDGEVIPMDNPRRDAGTSNDVVVSIRYVKAINSITIQSFRDRSYVMGFVVFEYTKTTDDAGSGDKLNPYGIYDAKIDDLNKELEAVKNSIATTAETTLQNSHKGRLLFNKIKGVSVQNGTPAIDSQIDIETSVVSQIKTRGSQCFDNKSAYFNNNASSATNITKTKTGVEFTTSIISTASGVYSRQRFTGEYTVSMDVVISDNNFNKLMIASMNALEIGNYEVGTVKHITVSRTMNDTPLTIYLDNSNLGVGTKVTVTNIMVNEGTVEMPYREYEESVITFSQPIELYGNDDLQDVAGDGNIKRRFKGVIFNGSESWIKDVTNLGFVRFYRRITDSLNLPYRSKIFSTHFRYSSSNQTDGSGVYVFTDGKIHLYADFDTVEEFKAWLSENNVTVIYPLAEENIEELPIADQIALNSLQTFDGTTYLDFDSEIEPEFECEYGTTKAGGYTLEGMLAGWNGELYGKNNANRISALESTVVNNI